MNDSGLKTVVVTINSQCNMSCPQCAYGYTNNSYEEEMSIKVFSELLTQCNDADVKCIRILGLSEPTLHNGFGEILFHLFQYRHISSHIITNGTMLLEDKLFDALIEFPPEILEISIDAFTSDLYNIVRGGNESLFQRVINGTRRIADKIKEGKSAKSWGSFLPNVVVSFVLHPESECEKKDFVDYWEPLVGGIHIRGPHNFSNYAKGLESQIQNNLNKLSGCDFLKSKLYIDVNGRAHACTLDMENAFVLGDITHGDNIIDMWSGKRRTSILASHTTGNNIHEQCIKCCKCSSLP